MVRRVDPLARVMATIESATTGVRRDGDVEMPLGRKAARTREALLEAAYKLFTEHGYSSTSVSDVATEAGVSLGAFYQYFRDRADILTTLVAIGAQQMLQDAAQVWHPLDGREGVRRSLHAFLAYYRDTAKFQRVWEEATHVDDEVATLRRELWRMYFRAIEAAIRQGQDAGVLDLDVEPIGTAVALSAMVDRTCYLRFVFDRQPGQGLEPTVDALTDVWCAAVGID